MPDPYPDPGLDLVLTAKTNPNPNKLFPIHKPGLSSVPGNLITAGWGGGKGTTRLLGQNTYLLLPKNHLRHIILNTASAVASVADLDPIGPGHLDLIKSVTI
jgi:hypothetical protein